MDLRDRIKEAAAKNGRSMNAEIVAALEAAYPANTKINFRFPPPDAHADADVPALRIILQEPSGKSLTTWALLQYLGRRLRAADDPSQLTLGLSLDIDPSAPIARRADDAEAHPPPPKPDAPE